MMDTKEIRSIAKAIEKAAQAKEPPSVFIDLFTKLKDEVKPTEELLRSTRIGVVINKQRHHTDKAVSKLAIELVSKWKNDVGKTGKAKVSSKSPPKSLNGVGSSPPLHENEPKITVALADRNWTRDKVDINRTGTTGRDKAIGLLYNALAPNVSNSPTIVLKHSVDIERACGSRFGPESDQYKAKLRSLYQNLRNARNPTLRERVLSGEITPEVFVRMTYDELKSPARREEDAKMEEQNMNSAMAAQPEKSISDQLECGKCKQRKVSYSQAQTRSADEPMTTFCECTVCGNRWKYS